MTSKHPPHLGMGILTPLELILYFSHNNNKTILDPWSINGGQLSLDLTLIIIKN
jgi:hypothetical protein